MTSDCLDAGARQKLWQELVPRLIHPTKLELIEALSWIGEPLSVAELFAVLAPPESPIDYVRYHLKGLCHAGVVIEVPALTTRHPEELRYSFNWSTGIGEP